MLARTLVVYSICSLQTYTLYLVSLITYILCFITVSFICQINHYHTILEQSRCCSDTDYIETLNQSHHKLSILNLNSQRIDAKFDQLKLFLAPTNTTNTTNTTNLILVITLQKSWCVSKTDIKFFSICKVWTWYMKIQSLISIAVNYICPQYHTSK